MTDACATAAPSTLLADWTDDKRSLFRREVVTFQHRLLETGLFTDEALARLIDSHPRDSLDICTMSRKPMSNETWAGGEAKGMSGADLIEATHRGRLWLNIRRAMNENPLYRPVLDQLLAEFSKATGARILRAHGSVLVSAPSCQVFYHCDQAETMLWHLRGQKTMYLYPPVEPYLADADYEAVVMRQNLGDIPYHAGLDAGADPVRLTPGSGVTWPLHAPHRVVNAETFNVSVSVEFTTPTSMMTNGTFYTQGVMRRSLGLSPKTRATPKVLQPVYWAASKLLKKVAPIRHDALAAHPRMFDVDLSAPDCIAWRPGYGPKDVALDAAA
jgi:hypothetical protein